MRFFTDHFFTEEQKVRILGDAYLKEREKTKQLEQEKQLAAEEAEQKKIQHALEARKSDTFAKVVEVVALAFILVASLLSWMGTPFSPLA